MLQFAEKKPCLSLPKQHEKRDGRQDSQGITAHSQQLCPIANSMFQTCMQLRQKQKRVIFRYEGSAKGVSCTKYSRRFTTHIPACFTTASWNSYALITTFQCIKNTLGKANNFKKNKFSPTWSYNINCWAVYMSAAFLSAIAITSPAVKVRDKTNIQGFWLPPASSSRSSHSSHIANQFLALHFPYRNLDALQCVPYWAHLCFPECQFGLSST